MNTPYDTLEEAKSEALRLSIANPRTYYTLDACFGIFITGHKRLGVFAPSDSCYKAYWHGGKERPFTEAQISQDWAHTPTMS